MLDTAPTKAQTFANAQRAIITLQKEVWQLRSEVNSLVTAVNVVQSKVDDLAGYKTRLFGVVVITVAAVVLGTATGFLLVTLT